MNTKRIVSVVVLSLALLVPAQVALADFQSETRAKLEKIQKDVDRMMKLLEKKKTMGAAERKRFDKHFEIIGREFENIEEYLERTEAGGS